MSAATLDFDEMVPRTNAVVAAAVGVVAVLEYHLRSLLLRGLLLLLAAVFLWWFLPKALRGIRQMHEGLAATVLRTDDDRTRMAEHARQIGGHASQLGVQLDKLSGGPVQSHWLARRLHERMEEICCEMEDAAETAALASSAEFDALVEKELRECLGENPNQGD